MTTSYFNALKTLIEYTNKIHFPSTPVPSYLKKIYADLSKPATFNWDLKLLDCMPNLQNNKNNNEQKLPKFIETTQFFLPNASIVEFFMLEADNNNLPLHYKKKFNSVLEIFLKTALDNGLDKYINIPNEVDTRTYADLVAFMSVETFKNFIKAGLDLGVVNSQLPQKYLDQWFGKSQNDMPDNQSNQEQIAKGKIILQYIKEHSHPVILQTYVNKLAFSCLQQGKLDFLNYLDQNYNIDFNFKGIVSQNLNLKDSLTLIYPANILPALEFLYSKGQKLDDNLKDRLLSNIDHAFGKGNVEGEVFKLKIIQSTQKIAKATKLQVL